MPFIPTIQPQQQAPTPDVPRGRAPRAPQVDLSGVASAAGRLAGASQQGEIPVAPFLAPGRGLQAVGQGLDAVGNVLAQLAEARAQAKNDLDLAESQTALDMAFADMEGVKLTTSPDRWQEEWSTRKTAAIEQVLNNDRLSPIARQRLQVLAKRWDGETSVRVARDSTLEIGRRAQDAWQVNFFRALDSGNLDRAAAINRNANPFYVPESVKYQNERAIAAKRDELAWQQEYAAIQADPDGYLVENGAVRDGEDPAAHSQRIGAARSASRAQFIERAQEMENLLVKPGVTAAEIEAATAGLEPAEAAKWKEAFAEMQSDERRKEMAKPENINVLWAKLDEAVDAFDRDAPDARAQYTAIRGTAIAGLPEGWRQHILSRLDGKWSAEPPDVPTALRDEVLTAIDGAYKEGQFGAVSAPVQEGYDKAAERWEMAVPGKTYERTRMTAEPLPEEKLKGARARKAVLKLRMMEAMKANPGWASDPAAAFQYLDGLKNGARREAAPGLRFGGGGVPEVEPPRRSARGLPSVMQQGQRPDTSGAADWLDTNLPDVPGPPGEASALLFPEEPPPVE